MPRKDVNKVVGRTIAGGWEEIKKALEGVLKSRILNKWIPEIWEKGAVRFTIHFQSIHGALTFMSGATLASEDRNMNTSFSALKEWGKQVRSIIGYRRLSGGGNA